LQKFGCGHTTQKSFTDKGCQLGMGSVTTLNLLQMSIMLSDVKRMYFQLLVYIANTAVNNRKFY